MADEPRPGSVRINGGPWLPCRFTLDGTSQYVDWELSAAGVEAMPGPVPVEIAICPGVSVFGDVTLTDVRVYQDYGWSFEAQGNGGLRGAP
jgi:hypothetical protein